MAAGSEYPGMARGEYFDRQVVEETFLRRTGTPIWIGESAGHLAGSAAGEPGPRLRRSQHPS